MEVLNEWWATGPPWMWSIWEYLCNHGSTIMDTAIAVLVVVAVFVSLEKGGRVFWEWRRRRDDRTMEQKLRHQFRGITRGWLVADIIDDALRDALEKGIISKRERRKALYMLGRNGFADLLPGQKKLTKDQANWLCANIKERLYTEDWKPVTFPDNVQSFNELKYYLGKV